MDVQKKIKEIVAAVNKDPDFHAKFQKDPVGAVKTVVGTEISEGRLNEIIEGVKAKVAVDKVGGIIGQSKGLFASEGKKFF